MVIGQAQFASLGRAACRALLSGAAPLTAESACARAFQQAANQVARSYSSETCSAVSEADDAAGCAPQRVLCSELETLTLSSSRALFRGNAGRLVGTGASATSPSSSQPALSHLHFLPSSLRSLHTSSLAASSDAASTSSPSQPAQNPLQAALQAAEAARASGSVAAADGTSGEALSGTLRAAAAAGGAAGRGRRKARNWMWYDESDEREERAKERQRAQYGNAGTAHLLDVPQSMKKMQRIVKLVRGLPYQEAVAQCQLVPHKAAKYVLQALERAHEDATEEKGLQADKLVVGTIFVTKGIYEKGIQPMGKGSAGRKVARKSHLRIVLTESRGRSSSFTPRVVAPLMGVMSRKGASPAWLGAAGAGAGAGRPRARFAYQLEV
ncbi:hypothetical protein Agub_g5688 [Astrephomene gubernaculifera]|uniref:50S ribosomal protein L22, chloroplastic n=1 Tax=Astrephomene gubernaculifera TaxID=47775 RepID=A0AAD3DQ63_9CHLO|nr:hypothetical protein Agub_g5688 [Astrephomene gubernaculifera]